MKMTIDRPASATSKNIRAASWVYVLASSAVLTSQPASVAVEITLPLTQDSDWTHNPSQDSLPQQFDVYEWFEALTDADYKSLSQTIERSSAVPTLPLRQIPMQ